MSDLTREALNTLAQSLRMMAEDGHLTAEIWTSTGDDEADYPDGKVVDVVRIDDRLHLVLEAE